MNDRLELHELPKAGGLPTVNGFASRLAIAALQKRDLDPAPLIRNAGLPPIDVINLQRRLPASAQARFLEFAAEALEDTALGLHLAKHANPRQAGLLFYTASAARDLSEALALIARYSRIMSEGVRLKVERAPDGLVVETIYSGISRHRSRQVIEFGLTIILKALREITGRNVRPERVACVNARNSDLREFERFFGCAVEFGARSDVVVYSHETADLPLATHDPHLLATLRPFCEEAAKARNTRAGTIREVVENEIQRLLPHGQARSDKVARALGLSVRTLSRRLAEEETSFAEVVDQLRRSLALQYIRDPAFTLAQISWLLGYEGGTSFHHAFKRWTGKAPTAIRNENSPAELA